uniref:PH domain-containing protein n=1 Tax=Schistosoma mansoni TaxID=6183 RepID=A0A3Q0KNF7_SCHMA
MLKNNIQNKHSEPHLPWLPVPNLLTEGDEFSLCYQETENPSKQMTWNKVFVQIDLWGFFIYWNSIEQKVVTTVDLMYIEDIEMCTDSDDLFESMETSFIRLQVSSEGLFESRATMAYGKLHKGIYDHSSIVFLLVKDNPETLKLWKDNLLRLVFTHYPTRVDLAPLELLWKQWTHLIIVYSNLSTWRKTQQPIHDRKSTISNCCILAAFGLEGNLLPSHRSYLSECSPINTDNVNIDHSSSNANIEETLLDNFTFDVFFDLFIHSWPREDIAELFSAYTKTKGFMNYQELNSFLHTSISYFTNSNVSLENSRNFKAVDKQKTLRHIKYLHLERTQNNQTPIKMKSFQKSHSRKSQNNSSLKRSKSCYTTNQTDLNQSQNLDILNLTSESLSSTTSPLHHNRNRMNDHKSISSLVSTNYKEFSEIVRRYETNQYAVSKCLLTNEGFYRLLLSSTYRELCVSRNPTFDTYDQTTESMSTVAEPSKCSLDESQHPLAHYYIKSAYLTHKTYSEDDIENTVQCNQVSFADTKIPKEPCSVIGYGIKSNKILRTIRQALLFGIRALILDCHYFSRLVGTETIISNELIIVPTNSNKVPTCFTERTSQDSFDLMRSILYKNYPYVLFKSVLQVLNENIFLISDHPFILIINLYGLGQEQQCRLANLLQEYLGQWIIVSPLPNYTSNLNGNNKLEKEINSTYIKPNYSRHLPSPEMLKNKILLSIRLVRTARSLSEDQSQELVTNKLQSHCTQTTLVKNPEIASPLTVFITNPEGERKSASQDIASTNSSSQLSPPAKHRLDLNKITDKSATPEDHNSNGWLPKCCGMYTNKIIDRNTAFSSQDEVSYLHPRLARLVVLPTPGFPPDTCIALHYQYLLRNSKSNFMDFDDKHFSESNILRRLQIRRKSEGPIHDSRCFKNMDSANIDKSDQQPDRKLEEGELLTSLFNLITTRKAQLKHRDRKRRLLKRLITEVCGNVANQKRSKSRENNTPSSNRKYAWSNSSEAQTTKVDYQTDKITTKQDEGWFKNRICASPTKPEESNISSKDTLLAATVRYARRLSNASVSRFNLSANSSSRNSECRDASMDSLNNQKHQQHLNNRWDADGSKRSADIYEDKEQNYNDFITKTSSLPMKKELKQNNSNSSRKSSKPQNPKQTKDLSDHISKRRPRKSTEGGHKRSPTSSCGHCSCSSGSRSEKGSPTHETPQHQTGQTKLSYFRDGIQKLRNKFASEKQKSFENYVPRFHSSSISKSRNSWSESEASRKSTDSLSNNSISTDSSPTVETSLSSDTESYRSESNTDNSISSSSSSENMVNKSNCMESPITTAVRKRFQTRLSSVRHSITSITNALFRQDKNSGRNILQKQSTIESQESGLTSTKNYWIDSLRWFIGSRITNMSSNDLIYLLSRKQMTKSLARYNKERLTCVFLSDQEKSWDVHQLFRSVGCQLIPYGLDISVTTHDLEKPVSVRQQFMKLNQMDELRNSFAMSENGYILKPALLRIPTINRYHRKLITRRKYQKLFPKSDPNSNNMRNQLSSYLRCACCYDPLDMSSECELIGKIYDGITNLNWPTTSSQEANFYLPWNYTLQLINFMKIHSLHPERSLLNRQESMETQSYQYNTVKPNKLPKRYRRAANATNTTPRRQRHASASRAAVVRNGASFKNFQSTPIKANSWGLTQVRHQSQENVNLNNRNIDFHERRRLNPLKRNYENIIIEAEIKAPLFKFSHLTTNISSRFCQVPEEHNIVRYCLYSNNSSFSTDDVTANNQYTLRKSKTLSRSSYVLSSMLNDKERIPMFSSFNSITRCNSELMLDWLSTRKVTFSRIHLPESICIRINTESHRKECDNDVKSYENMGNVIASCIINSNSPLNKALTGFQHFQLKLFDRYKTKIIPREKKDDVSEFIHSVFHERLKATIGLLIFCKINMDTYVPHSLGDLIETLTRKYDTRLRTIPSNQQTNDKQCSANRSKSYLYLDRHQSIKEISTLKQSIIRSNSFTYKEYGKNLQQNAT